MQARLLATTSLLALVTFLVYGPGGDGSAGVLPSLPIEQAAAGSAEGPRTELVAVAAAPGSDARKSSSGPLEGDVDGATRETTPAAKGGEDAAKPLGQILKGRVLFSSGEPLPRVEVGVGAIHPLASPGNTKGDAETAHDGSFEITGLAPGPFVLEIFGEESLPIVGRDTFQAGDEAVELLVDAALLRIVSVRQDREQVEMVGIELAGVATDETSPDDNFGSTSWTFATNRLVHELIVQTDRPYMLSSRDAEGAMYFAYLPGGLHAGIHDLELRSDPPNLGGALLRLNGDVTEPSLLLKIHDLMRNGHDVATTALVSLDAAGGYQAEVKGLLPGDYEADVSVPGAGFLALEELKLSFAIIEGETREISLTAFSGGRLELRVETAQGLSESDAKARAAVELRRLGEQAWTWADLTAKRKRSTTRGARIWIDGTPAKSAVLPAGIYELRVTADGYESLETEVEVVREQTTELRLTLR